MAALPPLFRPPEPLSVGGLGARVHGSRLLLEADGENQSPDGRKNRKDALRRKLMACHGWFSSTLDCVSRRSSSAKLPRPGVKRAVSIAKDRRDRRSLLPRFVTTQGRDKRSRLS